MLLLIALLTGCWPRCGSLDISGTTATNYEGNDYNAHWFESCGANMGTAGTWNLYGDGGAYIDFFWSAPGDRDWQSIDIEMSVAFPTDLVEPGATVGLDQMGGAVALNPCIDCRQDIAGLTDGTVEILSGSGDDDPCADDGPVYRVQWDLVFGEEGGPHYVTSGTDKIRFSNFLSEDCGGW